MAKTFAIVRKGYDPGEVDAFVREQAEAWRLELERAVESLEEWRRRAEHLSQSIAEVEQRLKSTEARRKDETAALESSVAEMRWARDQARSALDSERSERERLGGEAGDIVESARVEAARMLAVTESEIQQMYASARKRIGMAEEHTKDRIQRMMAAAVEVSPLNG